MAHCCWALMLFAAIAATYSAIRAMVCVRPSAAPYSLITRSRSVGRREIETHSQPRPAAKILENDRHGVLHRLDVFTAAVMKDDAFGRHDFVVGDAVLIIATVGSVHDETPDAARPHVEARRRGA